MWRLQYACSYICCDKSLREAEVQVVKFENNNNVAVENMAYNGMESDEDQDIIDLDSFDLPEEEPRENGHVNAYINREDLIIVHAGLELDDISLPNNEHETESVSDTDEEQAELDLGDIPVDEQPMNDHNGHMNREGMDTVHAVGELDESSDEEEEDLEEDAEEGIEEMVDQEDRNDIEIDINTVFPIDDERNDDRTSMGSESDENENDVEFMNAIIKLEEAQLPGKKSPTLTRDSSSDSLDSYEEAFRGTNMIDCQCCLIDRPLEKMTQCSEGHLFCLDCLKNYVHEAVFGQGKLNVECMLPDCEETFSRKHLEQTLPSKLFKSYEERLLQESLNMADIEGLVRCAQCDYAAILPDDYDVLQCENPICMQKTCRHCKKDWYGHEDRPCDIVDENETTIRTKYEEQLTEVKIRFCSKCKTGFTKQDGCNKLVCRCGMAMCYLCRTSKIDYSHFCSHPRDPNNIGCDKCKKCSLWTDPKDDEELAMMEVQETARRERRLRGLSGDKSIGADDNNQISNFYSIVYPGFSGY